MPEIYLPTATKQDLILAKVNSNGSKLDSITSTLSTITSTLATLNTKLDNVTTKLTTMDTKLNSIQSSLSNIQVSINNIGSEEGGNPSPGGSINVDMSGVISKLEELKTLLGNNGNGDNITVNEIMGNSKTIKMPNGGNYSYLPATVYGKGILKWVKCSMNSSGSERPTITIKIDGETSFSLSNMKYMNDSQIGWSLSGEQYFAINMPYKKSFEISTYTGNTGASYAEATAGYVEYTGEGGTSDPGDGGSINYQNGKAYSISNSGYGDPNNQKISGVGIVTGVYASVPTNIGLPGGVSITIDGNIFNYPGTYGQMNTTYGVVGLPAYSATNLPFYDGFEVDLSYNGTTYYRIDYIKYD